MNTTEEYQVNDTIVLCNAKGIPVVSTHVTRVTPARFETPEARFWKKDNRIVGDTLHHFYTGETIYTAHKATAELLAQYYEFQEELKRKKQLKEIKQEIAQHIHALFYTRNALRLDDPKELRECEQQLLEIYDRLTNKSKKSVDTSDSPC